MGAPHVSQPIKALDVQNLGKSTELERRTANTFVGVAQKRGPKWSPSKWTGRPKPAFCPGCLMLSHFVNLWFSDLYAPRFFLRVLRLKFWYLARFLGLRLGQGVAGAGWIWTRNVLVCVGSPFGLPRNPVFRSSRRRRFQGPLFFWRLPCCWVWYHSFLFLGF